MHRQAGRLGAAHQGEHPVRWGLAERLFPCKVVLVLNPFFLFARKHAWLRHDGQPVTLTREALAYLQGLPWAANAAEVEEFIRHASVAAGRSRIDLSCARETVGRLQAPIAPMHASPPAPTSCSGMGVRPLRQVEREAIEQALAYTKGNQTNAAKLLGVPRNTLLRKLARWKIPPASPATASRRRRHRSGRPDRD